MNSCNQMFPFQVVLCHLKNSKYVQTNRQVKSTLHSEVVTCILLRISWSVPYQIARITEWTWWARIVPAFFPNGWNWGREIFLCIHYLWKFFYWPISLCITRLYISVYINFLLHSLWIGIIIKKSLSMQSLVKLVDFYVRKRHHLI
jgi:hypothetical protein